MLLSGSPPPSSAAIAVYPQRSLGRRRGISPTRRRATATPSAQRGGSRGPGRPAPGPLLALPAAAGLKRVRREDPAQSAWPPGPLPGRRAGEVHAACPGALQAANSSSPAQGEAALSRQGCRFPGTPPRRPPAAWTWEERRTEPVTGSLRRARLLLASAGSQSFHDGDSLLCAEGLFASTAASPSPRSRYRGFTPSAAFPRPLTPPPFSVPLPCFGFPLS